MTVAKFHGYDGTVVTYGAPKTSYDDQGCEAGGVGDSFGYAHSADPVTGNFMGVMGGLHHAQRAGTTEHGPACGSGLESSSGSSVRSLLGAIGGILNIHSDYRSWSSGEH